TSRSSLASATRPSWSSSRTSPCGRLTSPGAPLRPTSSTKARPTTCSSSTSTRLPSTCLVARNTRRRSTWCTSRRTPTTGCS
ncbi:unnamed protein product, partial [Ectocarpus fasciculatus]